MANPALHRTHAAPRAGILAAMILACSLAAGCARDAAGGGQAAMDNAPLTITLTSPAFAAQQEIPRRHTCEGEDVAPELSWSGVPSSAKSLVLIVDDPDVPDPKAPRRTWVHWVVYNLPPTATSLPEGARELPQGARAGNNDWKKAAWGGPCPPIGRHRYFFKLYALDLVLPDLGPADKARLAKEMQGHVVARGELIGTYEKTQK